MPDYMTIRDVIEKLREAAKMYGESAATNVERVKFPVPGYTPYSSNGVELVTHFKD